jgi:hypothetical protein
MIDEQPHGLARDVDEHDLDIGSSGSEPGFDI